MSLMLRVTLGLVAGLLVGLAVAAGYGVWLPGVLEPVGTMWVNAIRLAVIPLVVSGLVVGTATNRAAVGRLSLRASVLMLASLVACVAFAEALAVPVFAHLNLSAEAQLKAPAVAAAAPLSAGQWLVDLVPANVFKAAADGALLPLIVVAIGFGLALSRVEATRREAVVRVFQGVSDAALIFVGFVVKLAPIGVFCLAVLLTAKMGLDAIRALAFYIVVFVVICWAFMLLVMYPAAMVLGRRGWGAVMRAALPGQAVGFAARSSMAALPAAYEGVRDGLHVSDEAASFFLPIAASVFRVGAAMAQVIGVIFLARVYGVALSPAQLISMLFVVVATSMTAPGIPGGSILVIAPVLAAAGIPVAGLALLLGADTVPDMFRTAANVTGWVTVASMLEPARVDASEIS